jgi:hypothetical protein
MKAQTLAAAFACLAAMSAPVLALDIGLGVAVGGGASASTGEGSGLSVGLNASANAGLGLDGLDSSGAISTTTAALSANGSGDASLTGNDELTQVIALIDASVWTELSLADASTEGATAYDVAEWLDAGSATSFNLALDANASEIEDLHAAIAANASLESWLEANNATAADVVAIGVAADGSLAVFTN